MERKHLTENERRRIAELLKSGHSLSRIASALYVAHTTIAREILAHRRWEAGQGDKVMCVCQVGLLTFSIFFSDL